MITTPLGEVTARWAAMIEEFRRYDARVDGAKLLEEVLEDLRQAERTAGDEVLNLTQAARESGYSADHLGRLVRDGTIPNAGRPHAPAIRRAELPVKPGWHGDGQPGQRSLSSREQIVRSAVNSDKEARR